MKKNTIHLILSSVVLAGIFIGCSKDASPSEPADVQAEENSEVWLAQAPEHAKSVAEARSLQPGEDVVVQGVIGGVVSPFSDEFAVFVLGDDSLLYCDEMGEDHCKTPWDACCEDADLRKNSIASIQFLDAEGFPVEQSAKESFGLKELDEITVKGFVAEGSTSNNLIITATGLFRKS